MLLSNELNSLIETTRGILTNLKRQEKDIKTEIRRASGSYDLEEGECEDTDDESLEDQSGISRDATQVHNVQNCSFSRNTKGPTKLLIAITIAILGSRRG